jgi:hypothetical protein
MLGQRGRERQEGEIDAPGHHLGEGIDRTTERNVLYVDPGGEAQALARPVRRGAEPAGGKVQHAGRGLGGVDQVGDRRPAFRRRGDQHARLHAEHGDGNEIVHRIVRQALVQGGVGPLGGRQEKERVTVGIGLGRRGGAGRPAGARPVLDHEGLADLLADLVEHDARDGIGGIAG